MEYLLFSHNKVKYCFLNKYLLSLNGVLIILNGVNMEIIEIIKDALVFPSTNMRVFLIFVLLTIFAGVFSTIGILLYILGVLNAEFFLWGGLAAVVAMLIGWIMSGYSISVIKSGIELEDEVPEFVWWDNFITGFNNFIVAIVYFIIPAFLVAVVGYMTNITGNIMAVATEISSQAVNVYTGASSSIAVDAISQAFAGLVGSLAVTLTAAVVLFVIFSFLQTIAEARLANTDSLGKALNVFEATKDIGRIGVVKVISVILLVIIVAAVINMILSAIFNYIPILSILSVFVSPYLVLFAQRAVGLLYSDIA